MKPRHQRRLGTWVEVVVLIAALVALVAGLERALVRPVPEGWLRVVFALSGAELLLIATGIGVSVACKLWARARARRRARVRPLAQAALASYLAGAGDVEEILRLARADRGLVEECLEECLRGVTGEPATAAVRLVAALGLLERWRRAAGARNPATRQRAIGRLALLPAELRNDVLLAALPDSDEGVRRAVVRGLVATADVAAAGEAIRLTAVRSLTERALLVDELRRRADRLAPEIFARGLAAEDEQTVVATLEMVRACGRLLPVPPVAALLRDARPAVRAAAVATVPYAVGGSTLAEPVLACLDDADPRVRVAAAIVLGRLRVAAALPALGRTLRSEDARLAVASAHALAALGRDGRRRLEAMVLHGDGVAPLAAAEALGQAFIGRTPEAAA
jgi:HEAT repeat protein